MVSVDESQEVKPTVAESQEVKPTVDYLGAESESLQEKPTVEEEMKQVSPSMGSLAPKKVLVH